MPMELDIQGLSLEQRDVCHNTIGANTFFMLVGDALVGQQALSVVRMGDGEKELLLHSQNQPGTLITRAPFGETWLRDFGCFEIDTETMKERLRSAANDCTYFAPQIMGIQRQQWAIAHLFQPRERYVDNWFVRTWSRKLQDQLLTHVKHVLFIHGNRTVQSAFTSRVESLGCQVDCLDLQMWQQAESVIEHAAGNNAQLVLFSGGPANKYIGPRIATGGCRPKVVLDLGQAAAKEWI